MRTLIFISLIIASITSRGQDLINTSGKSISNGTYSVDYTIGQFSTIAVSDSASFTFTQGFLQPDFNLVTIAEYNKQITLSVYPNPAQDFLFVKNSSVTLELFTLKIIDLQGKEIMQRKLNSTAEEINLSELMEGEYIIRVISSTSALENQYKIIKTNK